MNTVTQEIDEFIAANGGNCRDALNVALARLKAAEARAVMWEEIAAHEKELGNTLMEFTTTLHGIG